VEPLARTFVIAGLILLVGGVLLYLSPSLPLIGKLPGDLRIERPGFRLYFPLTTSLLLSGALTLALWLFSRFR